MTLSAIFQDAARTASSHRKNVVALRKLHLKKGRAIENEFCRCVTRILPVKKGHPEAERIMNFLEAYLDGFDVEGSTEASKEILDGLVSSLLELVLKGFKAKDKIVRFRVCQLVCKLLNHMEELDDDTFIRVRDELFLRARDKEATVRTQAASAISRLQDVGDEEEDEIVRECLLNMLQYDTSADVRKAVLWNIAVNTSTLPFILQRARDIDPQVRQLAYKKIGEDVEKMAFLTTEERDVLLNSGLSDRDTKVQKAAVAMLCEQWIPECDNQLLNLLHKMDVISGTAAEPVAKAYLLSRVNDEATPSIGIPYDEEMWNNLDVEEAFFLRAAISFFSDRQDELEEALPPLVKHSELLQKYGLLLAQTEDTDEAIAFGYILNQLLLIAEMQDFTDEMGRRDLLLGLRDMLSSLDLRKENMLIIVRIIKKLSSNESDFTRIVIEVLYTIYDVDMFESQQNPDRDEVTEEDSEKSILMLKCMEVIVCVLECTEENLPNNASMTGILESFILPSLTNEYPATQFAGFHCLSLACLLDKTLAQTHLQLFISAFNDSRTELSTLALKVFFDLSILFGPDLLITPGLLTEVISETLQCDDEDLLTLAVEGSAKLMMLSFLMDELILQQIIVLYYHPHTKDMNRLRQCLSYFLPVFAHASHQGQCLLQAVIVPCLHILAQEYLVSKDDMIQPLQIGQQLVDWIDSRKVVRFDTGESDADQGLHATLAVQLLQTVEDDEDPAMQKLCAQLLSRLCITESVGVDKLSQIVQSVASLIQTQPKGSVLLPPLKKFGKAIAELDETALPQPTEEELDDLQKMIESMSELRIDLGVGVEKGQDEE
ncbi:hypothetical protein PhCBS80983_g05418 [Powellomyces hirtus]|uniref:Nuclear condensin complex subunit 3 C-terminal domain-containing protein n=1 Tax=Powellomyces hirtus TaxID=109895 RepID=A0A507DVW1_9FUNG|nr:hypothetical protein PhCBS80983_g05418 [Powellomyces hirtus]